MSAPLTREELEERYDGLIPQEELDRLKHGSAANAEIARIEDSMAFFEDERQRMLRSADRCYKRGNMVMYRHNTADADFYLARWNDLNTRRNMLRADRAALANGALVMDQINQVIDDEATEDS